MHQSSRSILQHSRRLGRGGGRSSTGMAMVMVMGAIVIASIMALSFFSTQTTSVAVAHNIVRQSQARAVAESGLQLVLAQIRRDEDWRSGWTHGVWLADQSFDGGTFRAQIEDADDGDLADDPADAFTVTVEGRFGGAVFKATQLVTPGPGAGPRLRVVMIADAEVPSQQDRDKAALFQSWGMSVMMVADNATTSAYDSAIADADVIYISEEASTSSIGARLTDRPVGIVCEEYAYNDDLGLVSGNGEYNGVAVNILDNAHPVTEGLPLGVVSIASRSTSLGRKIGTIAAGATTLAQRSDNTEAALLVLETGDPRLDASPAPARRVALPFGGSSFDINRLNTAGRLMLRQALEWAGTTPPAPEGLLAEWVNFTGNIPAWAVDNVPWDQVDHTTIEAQVNFPNTSGTSFSSNGRTDNFAVKLTGAITLPSSGEWGFRIGSDDGSKLRINEQIVVDHDGLHGYSNRDATVVLQKGIYPFDVRFYERGGSQGLIVSWRPPGSSAWEVIPPSAFAKALPNEPQKLAQYEFAPPPPVQPQLVAHWPLNEPAGGQGGQLTARGNIRLLDQGRIDTYDARQGTYSATRGGGAVVTTQQTAASVFQLTQTAIIDGDAYCGVGGDPATAFRLTQQGRVTGFVGVAPAALDTSVPQPPTMTETASTRLDRYAQQNVIDADVRYGSWSLRNDAQVTVSGHRTVVITGSCTFADRAQIIIPAGSSLTLYVGGNLVLNNQTQLQADPRATDRLTVYQYGNGGELQVRSDSLTAGRFHVAGRTLVSNQGRLYGSLTVGGALDVVNNSIVSLDRSLAPAGGASLARELQGGLSGAYRGGVITGQPGWATGQLATSFDGVDDFVAVPHASQYLLDSGSAGLWFRPERTSGVQGLLAKDASGYGAGGHLRLYLDGSRLGVRLQSHEASYTLESAAGAVQSGRWHHAAVGFGAGGLRLYLDGQLVGESEFSGGLADNSLGAANTEPWTFAVDQAVSSTGSTDGWNNAYRGRLADVRLYDQNLTSAQVQLLIATGDPGPAAGSLVADTAGVGVPLDLFIRDTSRVTWLPGGGLTLNRPTTIASATAAARVVQALKNRQSFTFEVRVTPANLTQTGPATLLSLAASSTDRNLHVGQRAAAYTAQLRTAFNLSGNPAAASGAVLSNQTVQHLIVSYDGQTLRGYRNGALEISEPWTGSLDNWAEDYRLFLGAEPGNARPWLGTFHQVTLWDRSINNVQAENLFNGNPPGPADGGDAGYRYDTIWIENP